MDQKREIESEAMHTSNVSKPSCDALAVADVYAIFSPIGGKKYCLMLIPQRSLNIYTYRK